MATGDESKTDGIGAESRPDEERLQTIVDSLSKLTTETPSEVMSKIDKVINERNNTRSVRDPFNIIADPVCSKMAGNLSRSSKYQVVFGQILSNNEDHFDDLLRETVKNACNQFTQMYRELEESLRKSITREPTDFAEIIPVESGAKQLGEFLERFNKEYKTTTSSKKIEKILLFVDIFCQLDCMRLLLLSQVASLLEVKDPARAKQYKQFTCSDITRHKLGFLSKPNQQQHIPLSMAWVARQPRSDSMVPGYSKFMHLRNLKIFPKECQIRPKIRTGVCLSMTKNGLVKGKASRYTSWSIERGPNGCKISTMDDREKKYLCYESANLAGYKRLSMQSDLECQRNRNKYDRFWDFVLYDDAFVIFNVTKRPIKALHLTKANKLTMQQGEPGSNAMWVIDEYIRDDQARASVRSRVDGLTHKPCAWHDVAPDYPKNIEQFDDESARKKLIDMLLKMEQAGDTRKPPE